MRFLEKRKPALVVTATLCLLASALNGPAAAKRHAPAPQASADTAPTASPGAPPTAQPSPSAEAPTSSPSPDAATPEGRRRRGGSVEPSPSPTPTSPAFSTLDGYWEVVLQTPSDNTYSHFDLRQSADTITGTWTRDKEQLPIEGSYDGRTFKLVVKALPHDLVLAGYVENASDMVGTVDDGSGKDSTAFTASHRATYHMNVFPKHDKKK